MPFSLILKSYTTGSIANGSDAESSFFVALMIAAMRRCASALRCGAKMNPMPPPLIPPSIQKPQKSKPNSARADSMSRSV